MVSVRALLQPLRRTRLGQALATSPLRPRNWASSLKAARTLWFAYGHVKSVRSSSSVDGGGEPVPWYTYPAIEFLKQFDFSEMSVFEYGAGNSTLFWARRAARVVSVEDEDGWAEELRPRLPANTTLVHEPDLQRYVAVIDGFPGGFDIIVVDGPARGRTRLACARKAIEHLKPGGLVILDNSDWLPESARLLRDSGLLQVDMAGFVPIAAHTQTTSFFFHRACQLRPKGDRQPLPSAGAALKTWETMTPPDGPTVRWAGETVYGVLRHEAIEIAAPAGMRTFEAVVYRGTSGSRRLMIFDVAAQRVVLGPYVIGDTERATDTELARLRSLSWDDFRDFVRGHDSRRYILE